MLFIYVMIQMLTMACEQKKRLLSDYMINLYINNYFTFWHKSIILALKNDKKYLKYFTLRGINI